MVDESSGLVWYIYTFVYVYMSWVIAQLLQKKLFDNSFSMKPPERHFISQIYFG